MADFGRWKSRVRGLASAAVAVGVLAGATAGTASAAYPVTYSFPVGLAKGLAAPTASPPGANNWSCKPSSAHPYPVVLVHGTVENMADNWNALSPLLADNGYCVFALNYGGAAGSPLQATGPIATSAQQLAAFVDKVRSATGAAKVDIVGHSQGGMMPRYYIRFLGGATKVHRLVALTPSNHGTNLDGIVQLAQQIPGSSQLIGALCPACLDQVVGSAFLTKLNAGHDTEPGVLYTVISTKYDEVVTPYTSAFLSGSNVTNITVQSQCSLDHSEHLAISYDEIALRDVLNALDPAHAVAPRCVPVAPFIGG